jgi:hypothetical protein
MCPLEAMLPAAQGVFCLPDRKVISEREGVLLA